MLAADPAALEADEAARKRGMARLQQLLDTGGGVADPDKAGGQLQEAMPHQDCCCRGVDGLQCVDCGAQNACVACLTSDVTPMNRPCGGGESYCPPQVRSRR